MVRLIKMIRLDEKKTIIKVKGLLVEYAPINRSIPKIVKNIERRIIIHWIHHHEYFIKLQI